MGTRIFVFFPLCFVVVAVWTQVYNSSMEKLVKSMRCILVERNSNIVGREPWKLKTVKNPPAMWETWAQSLGWEDLLKKGTATHPVFWAGELHGLYSPWGRRVGPD